MNKKTLTTVFIVLLLLISISLVPVRAVEDIAMLNSSASVDFPARLQFHLSARSGSDIEDVRLRYTVEKMRFADVVSEAFVEFTPALTVDLNWPLEMVKIGGLPPGTIIYYWWLIKNLAGAKMETARSRIQFDDNRYTWQSLSEGKVTIYWYDGEKGFSQGLMKIAQDTLSRLAQYTGITLEKPVRLYVYANSRDLRGAMIHPQEWTGGVSFTRYGIISLSVRPGDLDWADEVIPHELTHLVIHEMVLNPYNDVPTWLDEGLALYMEGDLSYELKAYLHFGISGNNLLSVRSIASPFSANRDEAALSYGQSYSLVDFLIKKYGQNKMLELLKTYKLGSNYDAALERVYGFNMDGLDALWRKYVGAPERRAESSSAVPAPATK